MDRPVWKTLAAGQVWREWIDSGYTADGGEGGGRDTERE